ncbi:MAG: hypothetical protein RLZZ387_4805 [Chloroflexota bacterium]
MRLREADWASFRLPYAAPFATAHGVEHVREGLLLRLRADTGHEGLGEASPVTAFGGGSAADARAVAAGITLRLAGITQEEADALLAGLDLSLPGAAAVACALDTALLDLRARQADVPLARLLTDQPRTAVAVNATVGAADTTVACAAATRAVEQGFRCVKLKVGVVGGADAELARLAAVRAAVGPGVALRIDANGAWDVGQAIAILRAAAPLGLELAEQPVPADDLSGMARVRAAVTVPIAADEPVGTPEQAARVIAADAADLLVVKPMLAGGLRPALRIIEAARAAGLGTIVTTTIDSGVGCAAALHLAAALPEPALACGLATGPLLAGDLVAHPLAASRGSMALPATPGLGVVLDEAALVRWR